MTEFQIIMLDLTACILVCEVIRLCFMLYAKFKPYFHKNKVDGK